MITRLKLPFGKMPPQFDDKGVQQWSDYCAVTDVNSDKPDEIVLVDLALTGLSKADAVKAADVSEAKAEDMEAFEIEEKCGLPGFEVAAIEMEK